MKIQFLFAMAWRESRAARRRLSLLVAAVAIGVAALVAINSFTTNLLDAIETQGKALLGADLRITGRTPFSTEMEALIDSIAEGTLAELCQEGDGCDLTPGDIVARRTDFDAMAYVPESEGTRFVRVNAVAGPYPFYGSIETGPADQWESLLSGHSTIVDPALLTVLDAHLGDTLVLGEGRFEIIATIEDIPGSAGVESAFAPRLFISQEWVEETQLITFGSRVAYRAYLRLANEEAAEVLADQYGPQLRPDRISMWTAKRDREDTLQDLDQLSRYLGLVALIALLLGGLGVASAVNVFIKQKRETIAVLRCLGATSRQVFATYLMQAIGIGLVGSILGTGIGMLLQNVIPSIVGDFLPVDVEVRPAPGAIAIGLAAGIWVATTFAFLPLIAIRRITPLAALRAPYDQTTRSPRDPWRWLVGLALAVSVVGLAITQAPSVNEGLAFGLGIGVTLLVLWLAALLLIKGIRRYFPKRWPYVYRQGLANLYRPANQTVSLVLALGFGTFLLSTLFLVQSNLLRDLRIDGGDDRPNLVMIDIQPDQIGPINSALDSAGYPLQEAVPLVPMRIKAINGVEVLQISASDSTEGDSTPAPSRWAFRREYRSTYRDTAMTSEILLEGEWWDSSGAGEAGEGSTRVYQVSLEEEIAEELGVGMNDQITWNVQGLPIETRITSIREVNWAQFQPNFFAVFEPGALDDAPQMFVTLTRVDDAGDRGRIQRLLAEGFPNVSSIDLGLVQRTLDRIIGSMVTAIRFMALFSLATGAVVLIGAVATSRFQRVRESVLLKTLGGTRNQILRVLLTEYVAIGTLSAMVAIGLSTVAAWSIMHFVFESGFSLPLLELAGLTVALVGITVVVGLWNSTEIFRAPPLAVLRAE
jgi:putative ABC transport system permease protein